METTEIPSPGKFLVEGPLYEAVDATELDVWKLVDIAFYDGTYDAFCVNCQKDSTFKATCEYQRPPELVRDLNREDKLRRAGAAPSIPRMPSRLFLLEGTCARSADHKQHFLLRGGPTFKSVKKADGTAGLKIVQFVEKIGQHPSYADMHLARVRKYSRVLAKAQMSELNRGIGLASHGIGIGAYVYLRRIFEHLVEEARAAAATEPGWDEDGYAQSRMAERVRMLRDYLPSFLVEHHQMYALLSKGVHELSEEECVRHFPALLVAIELILDQRLEQKTKEARIKEAKEALAKALGEANGPPTK